MSLRQIGKHLEAGTSVTLKQNIDAMPVGAQKAVPVAAGTILRIIRYEDDLKVGVYVVTAWTSSGALAAPGEYEIASKKLESVI